VLWWMDAMRPHKGEGRLWRWQLLALLALLVVGASARVADPRVFVLRVDGVISPAAALYVRRGIEEARRAGAEALVIELDTPGGLMKSMDEITQALLGSPVPVIVYVTPSGARAASAGLFIVYAAHVAAMAPTTNLGAATPVFAGGDGGPEGENQRTLRRKVTEDAVARLRTFAARRHRNAAWAEKAVRQAVSLPSEEAVRLNVVDLLARDRDELLRRVDGRVVELPGGTRRLRTANAETVPVAMDLRERFLDLLADPNLGLILMTLAIYGIILELSHPGAILPGIVGGIALILALASFAILQVNYAGVALIGFALLLFVADLLLPAHGILTVGGVISFLLGALLLTRQQAPYLQVSMHVAFLLAGLTGAFSFFVVGAALRAQRRRPAVGREALVGAPGVARTDLKPQGMVFAQGELWSAETVDEPVPAGEPVRVIAVEGLKLWVQWERSK
jgi:membrane-bound serine protease (ClpP class)